MNNDETMFDGFWEVSSLDRFNVQQFSQKLNSYDSEDKEMLLEYPKAVSLLPSAKTTVNKLAKKRKSDRVFSGAELSTKEVSILLSSFYSWNGLEHRGYPSAGAVYSTEIFCVAFNAENLTGQILYYDPEKHGIVSVSKSAPTWETASESLNMDIKGSPSMLIIFVTFPSRSTTKYGERGGRFSLIEVGGALQQLSLQVANTSKLKGVAVGGMLDEFWKRELRLGDTDARISLGYLIGK